MTRNIKSNWVLFVLLLFSFSINAQGVNGKVRNAYVPMNGFISIFGTQNFSSDGYPNVIYTNKSSNPGYVNFVNNGNWINAGENGYIDGFAKVYHDNPFTFPIGDLGFYRPLTIDGGRGTAAAYFFDDANNIKEVKIAQKKNGTNESLKVLPSGYWLIEGSKPINITLHWDQSTNLNHLKISDLKELEIVGWNGEDWEILQTKVEEFVLDTKSTDKKYLAKKSSLLEGSISTQLKIIPDKYKIITLGKKSSNPVSFNGNLVEKPYTSAFIDTEEIEFTIFPNPALNLNDMKVDYDISKVDSKAYLVIYDNAGKLISKELLDSKNDIFKVKSQHQTSNTYYIGIQTQKGSKKFETVVINRM